ncbi:hypothetical protein BSKO_10326 [Bryopsis sp. KO-2023]|nr:hypothetical protein BSKO_10326 [Bryopsis sp. KO-2023]
MEVFYYLTFGALAAACAFLEFRKPAESLVGAKDGFLVFRNGYLLVYCLMMAGDWLQGPYVYRLYQHYGYDVGDIGKLFIAGFGASLVFGTIVGSLADKHGRKSAALTYCLTYILSCVTKHWSNYSVLMVGRVFGGIATSLLFSAFESWLVAEHFKRGFAESLLGQTFSKAVLLGNGLVAILSGLLGNLLVEPLALGPVAPFDAALVLLFIGGVVIAWLWTENYGDSSEQKSLMEQFGQAWEALKSDPKIALLGAMQSLFEGSMYTFVFLWTPALGPHGVHIPHGFIFACFMVASMIGSALAGSFLDKGLRPESYMKAVFGVAAASLAVPVLVHVGGGSDGEGSHENGTGMTVAGKIQFFAFIVFEGTVGLFWPSMMKMRSQYVPEHLRSTLINFFRIPLNIFVCIVLYNVSKFPLAAMFAVCSGFLVITMLCQIKMATITDVGYIPLQQSE